MDLVTKDDVRLYDPALGVNVDDVLGLLISAQSEFVCEYTGQTYASTPYSERQGYVASGDTIIPKHTPLVSVQSLKINDETIPAITAEVTAGYRVEGDVIKLEGYRVGKKTKIEIAYTAGSAASADLKWAVIQLVILAMKERGSIGSQSQSMAGYSVSYLPSMVPNRVREVLERHRAKGF
jgi:hypothetical protein